MSIDLSDRTVSTAVEAERGASDFFENTCVALHWVGPDGVILRANQAELDLLGYRPEEYVGRHISEFHADRPVIDDILARLARGETLHKYPARLRCKDGSIRHVMISSNVLFEDGEFVHTRCVTLDVTEQKRAEAAQAESDVRLRAVADAAPVLIANCDAEARFKLVNKPYAERFGLEPEEVVGKHLAEVLGEEAYRSIQPYVAEALEGRAVEFEVEVPYKSGRQFMRCAYTPERDQHGRVVGWVAAILNITDRRRVEEALRQSERRFRDMIDALPAALYVTDAEGRLTHFNQAAMNLAGRVPDLGSDRWCVTWRLYKIDGTPLPHDECPMAVALKEGRSIHGEEIIAEQPGGERVYVAAYPTPLRDETGRVVGGINMLLDITESKLAEKQLRESEERYRRLAELLPVGVYTCAAPSGMITYYNEHAAQLWGRAPRPGDTDERFCGSFELYLPDGRHLPHDQCPVAVTLREGRTFRNEEVVMRRPDGSRVPVLVNIGPIRDDAGRITGAINVFHDMSALKRVEKELREQKADLQTLLDTLPVPVFIAHDPECRRISGNRAACELLRMPAEGNLSKSARPETPPSHFQIFKDGQAIPSAELPMQRAARGEIVNAEEMQHVFLDGKVSHTLISARPLHDAEGRLRGAVASMLDITDLKNAESALREADRRKDEFLATLSHELRNPLAPIRAALSILGETRSTPARFAQAEAVMARQVEQLVRLIDDLLDVSRISRGKIPLRKERTELASVVRQALEMSRPLADAKGHAIEVELPEPELHLDADPIRLAQVFSNLLNNACKYTPTGGLIRLYAERQSDGVSIVVQDSGIGLPPEKLESIFAMFSQVASQDRSNDGGLGIGLSLAKRLVELHGGIIEARSDGLGRGSRFIVRLPVLSEALATPPRRDEPDADAAPPVSRGGRRVLVVDDNTDAATMLAALLELDGHDVRMSYDGREAIAQAAAFKPAVILLDIGLPELDGYEVCRRIRREPWGKHIVIVALTGWGQEEDRRRSVEAEFDGHLVKPIAPETLAPFLEAGVAEDR